MAHGFRHRLGGLGSSGKVAEAAQSLDWTQELEHANPLKLGRLADLTLPSDVTAMAYDPLQGLLAVGTHSGTVHVFGAQAVRTSWKIKSRQDQRIKLLQFWTGTPLLIIIDESNTLSIFDLATLEHRSQPTRYAVTSLRSDVTAIESTHVHSHLFIGFRDGSIDCYDLACARISGHRISNLWLEQEEVLRRSGVPDAPSRRHIPVLVDIHIHPTDLNILAVAYEGGVALYDIRAREVRSTFDLIIPPGALGGGGDSGERLFTERRPAVTCIAFRHDGLVLAVGHIDGSISFWDLNDADHPLLVRTLDRTDVNIANAADLFNTDETQQDEQPREPIFKLSWASPPEQGFVERMTTAAPASLETQLIVLGGLTPSDRAGVYVMHFPLVAALASTGQAATSPIKQAFGRLRDSLNPTKRSVYPTLDAAQDYLVLPRTAQAGLANDPFGLVITSSAQEQPKDMTAWSFPPRHAELQEELALPTLLAWSGKRCISTSSIRSVSSEAHKQLQRRRETRLPALPLAGGTAQPRARGHEKLEAMVSAVQLEEHRILLTGHRDLSVCISDLSSSLLAPSYAQDMTQDSRLRRDFPSLLYSLPGQTVLAALRENHHRRLDLRPDLSVTHIELCEDSLELLVVFNDGQSLIFRLGSAGEAEYEGPPASSRKSEIPLPAHDAPAWTESTSPPPPVRPARSLLRTQSGEVPPPRPARRRPLEGQNWQVDSTNISRLSVPGKFKPMYRVQCSSDILTALDFKIGFVALAYGPNLAVFDLRTGEAIPRPQASNVREVISVLKFIVGPTEEDAESAVRLLEVRTSGQCTVLDFHQAADTWIISSERRVFDHNSLSKPLNAMVCDIRGKNLAASPQLLEMAMLAQRDPMMRREREKGPNLHSLSFVIATRSMASFVNTTGTRLTKIDFEVEAVGAAMLHLQGRLLLAVYFRDGSVRAYRVPGHLEEIQLVNTIDDFKAVPPVEVTPSGDCLRTDHDGIHLITLCDVLRPAYPPALTLHNPRNNVRTQAIATMGSTVMSWFGGVAGPATGAEIDSLLAGPNRPPPKTAPTATPDSAAPRRGPVATPSSSTGTDYSKINRQRATEETAQTRDYLAELQQGLSERGMKLENLQNGLNDMSAGASSMLANAKRMAVQQAAKQKLASMFT
ncbi:uncharacterized protein L969DRAFT_103974 [Mixia osmundae IAM 14324]|uniref:Lethal giant larvae (Lgl)-like C-terminal domain-containing protein n=1 Tax=Mixia osmundae (strain CBS 9802 / IAM 14324 / JCM 22182 / KY 12970) TaxID=764103 RepID=G7E711_MIXOS|nr:uncharacterized protein L969DRAFT_103974 [Mixia osmundae IAM 14324]KEI38997.1 hypothetical protein L969DRAFT_103974 [Mixia osmundae IAM 14324]GAA98621.1 hypothetical protein E5Q_05308 [Mixia osmundae IAM 14324]